MDAIKSPADVSDLVRFHRAILEIDLRNADDPHFIRHHGHDHLKEQLHAQLVTEWVWRLNHAPSEALLLAARAHHLRRWTIAREDYPTGRAGYLQWRAALKNVHATEAAAVLEREGFAPEAIDRVKEILLRHRLKADPDQQTLEDAICLTFLETQLQQTADKVNETKLVEILRKTFGKMSAEAVELARHLHLSHDARQLMARAGGGQTMAPPPAE